MMGSRTARHRGWIYLSSCALALAWGGILVAQQTADDIPAGKESSPHASHKSRPNSIKVVEPRVVFLRDKDGEPTWFYNMPLEEFERIYALHKGLTQQALLPRYGLEQIEIDGVSGTDHVLLDIKIHVVVHDENWVGIPLGLNEGHLRARLEHDEGVEGYVAIDPESAGHVCYIKSEPDKKTMIRLRMSYRTEQVGRETRLSLNIARSSLTKLTLRIPDRDVVATVDDEARLQLVEPLPDGGTRIDVVEIGGQLHLAWREGPLESRRETSLLEATGAILVDVVAPGNIRSQARLQLRSFGKPVELVRVELPPGAQLLRSPQPGYTVEIVGDRQDPPPPDVRQAVDIKFERPHTSPPEIQLKTERVLESERQDDLIEVAGFRVVGAFRQSGHIALAAGSESYPRWNEGPFIRRINSLPDSLQQESILASFEYFRQPCSLEVHIERRESQIVIETFHTLLVEPDRLRLETYLDVTVRGAKASFLDVDMQDWIVEDVEPEELVNKTALVLEETSPLKIRLKQPSTGKLQLVIRAVRQLPTEHGNRFKVTLPRAHSRALRAARLAVVPDDNIALTPRSQELHGLNVDTASSHPAIFPERQQEPFFYSESTTVSPATFSADFVVRKRSIATALHSSVTIREENFRVRQRIEYDVRHEPIEQLPVILPVALTEETNVKYDVNGEQIDSIVTVNRTNGSRTNGTDDESGANEGSPRRILVPLRRPRSGKVVLSIEFVVPSRTLTPGTSETLSVPFALPFVGNIVKHTLDVVSHPPLIAAVEDPSWVRREETVVASADQAVARWTSNGEPASVQLAVSRPTREEGETTEVDLAWVQTWLSRDERQDRAAFQLSTANSSLSLRLPVGAQREHLEVRVNGQRATPTKSADSMITIDLRFTGQPDTNFLVELWYPVKAGRPAVGSMWIETPRVVGDTWTRQSYWQLISPRDELLLHNPPSLTPEFNWAWPMSFARRRTDVTGRMEKQLATFGRQPGPSAHGTNQYLFSTLSDLPAIQVRTASQKTVLLVLAATVSACGLLLIYVSALRHPAVLLLLAVAILSFGQRFPETSVLIAQAGALGIALVLFQRVVRWLLLWRKRHEGIVHGTTSSSIERLTTSVEHVQPDREDSRVMSTESATSPSSVSHSRL